MLIRVKIQVKNKHESFAWRKVSRKILQTNAFERNKLWRSAKYSKLKNRTHRVRWHRMSLGNVFSRSRSGQTRSVRFRHCLNNKPAPSNRPQKLLNRYQENHLPQKLNPRLQSQHQGPLTLVHHRLERSWAVFIWLCHRWVWQSRMSIHCKRLLHEIGEETSQRGLYRLGRTGYVLWGQWTLL